MQNTEYQNADTSIIQTIDFESNRSEFWIETSLARWAKIIKKKKEKYFREKGRPAISSARRGAYKFNATLKRSKEEKKAKGDQAADVADTRRKSGDDEEVPSSSSLAAAAWAPWGRPIKTLWAESTATRGRRRINRTSAPSFRLVEQSLRTILCGHGAGLVRSRPGAVSEEMRRCTVGAPVWASARARPRENKGARCVSPITRPVSWYTFQQLSSIYDYREN